ncbi:DUF805 domain-containing protein [Pseudomonas sp. C1C7]|uniref:DUF805 domain-containing protein n=1 Tax=Pseudomonas sp. C1C7 TaxID=2735272 RepID=UPI001586DEE7|nr:DUF805 domain-containing protein [Pseudomonas sp. C1C7]NUT77256.1 DUF805 domain-containing protein [Pseudomonas sp. C1C7]
MSDNRFNIVFDGTLLPGVDINTAKLNIAALYKSDVAAVERLFNGHAVVLKRDLTQSDAQAYLQALKNAGIDARVEPVTLIELNLSDVHQPSPVATPEEPDSPYAPPQARVGEQLAEFATLKPFGVEGRIGRLRFLAWSMVLSLVAIAVISVFAVVGLALVSTDSTAGLIIGGFLAFILCIVFIIASVMITVQRLHDLGWSGWLWLLNLVPFVGSFFPLVMMAMPGNQTANRYGAPPPPNSTAVKVLSSLWVVLLALIIVGALAGGISAIQDEYENTLESSYQSSSQITEEIEVQAQSPANSADDAAEQAQPPVDSAQE